MSNKLHQGAHTIIIMTDAGMPRGEKSATFSKSVPVYYCYCYFKVFILQESRTLSKSTRFEAQDKSAAFVRKQQTAISFSL